MAADVQYMSPSEPSCWYFWLILFKVHPIRTLLFLL